MKDRPELSITKPAQPGSGSRPRQAVLPTVFMRSSILAEALCPQKEAAIPFIPFRALIGGIEKKCGELREQLRECGSAGKGRQSFSVAEAELVLRNAERLLPALPAGQSSLAPDAVHELKYRAVDAILMLDAAIRALQSP